MQLSEMACKILEFFHDTYREPSARISMATLDTHFGMGPAVDVKIVSPPKKRAPLLRCPSSADCR
jgi:hypothetical protein